MQSLYEQAVLRKGQGQKRSLLTTNTPSSQSMKCSPWEEDSVNQNVKTIA